MSVNVVASFVSVLNGTKFVGVVPPELRKMSMFFMSVSAGFFHFSVIVDPSLDVVRSVGAAGGASAELELLLDTVPKMPKEEK